ncbi:MAG: hypothetical protein AAGA64_11685 [Bacteroidota bacterium]
MPDRRELIPPPISGRFIAVFFAGIILAMHIFMYCTEMSFPRGELADPDGYMWLQRVTELKENQQWYDQVEERTNTPYGDILHWTRPLDICLLAGGLILSPFLGFEFGLYYWGVFFSPCMHLIVFFLLLYLAKILALKTELHWLPILSLMQICLFIQFQVGRPDHQSLLLIVFTASLIPVTRILKEDYDLKACIFSGLSLAILIWVCVEGLIQTLLVYGFLFLIWIFNLQPNGLKKLVVFTVTLFAGTATAVLLEHPPSRFFIAYQDEISVLQFFLITLISLSCLLLLLVEPLLRTPWRRFIGLSLVGFLSVVVMYKCYPNFFLGPFSEVDSEVARIWLARVAESVPLYSDGVIRFIDMFLLLGPVFASLPLLIWLCLKRKDSLQLVWCFITLALLIYTMLAIFHRYRWAAYAELLSVIPLTSTFALLNQFLLNKLPRIRQSLITLVSLFLIGLSPLLIGSILSMLITSHQSSLLTKDVPILTNNGVPFNPIERKELPMKSLLSHLDSYTGFDNQPKRMMAFINFGPEILYRTKHSIVSSPYHRNTDAILDEYYFFTSDDFSISKEIIQKRKIDLVVIAPGYRGECYYYNWPVKQQTLYAHLASGKLPDWLKEVLLPDYLQEYFKVFRVTTPK